MAVLAIGAVAARASSRSEAAFLIGDRSFGSFTAWAALSSTTIGGSTTLVLAALVASKGLPALWLDLAGALGLLVLGLFLARRIRESGAVTVSEVIGRTYGPSVRRIAAVLVVLAEILWFALLTSATKTVVTAVTDWDPTVVLLSTAAIFVAYTALGGQRAVVGTDVLQFALMVLALLGIAVPLAIRSLAETGFPQDAMHFPVGPRLSWLDLLALLVLVGLPHVVGSDVWSKLLSARDVNAARRAALFASLSKLVFGLGTVTIALAGLAAGIPSGASALYPRTIFALAGPGFAPILLVALIATMQSSSDSVLLSAAAAIAHDIAPRPLPPFAARLLVVVFGGLGLFVAIVHPDLLETFRLGYTLFASSLILPTLVAFVPGFVVQPRYAGAAMVVGGCAAMAERFGHVFGVDPVLVGTGFNVLVLAIGIRRRTS